MLATACLAALLAGASAGTEADAAPGPLKPGLSEGVETRLVQFEMRVTRKGASVSGLTAADFDIELGGKLLKKFTVDDMCTVGPSAVPEIQSARPGSYIFYFDEQELTIDGRHRAIEVARRVAPALLSRGHDVMIVRNRDALGVDTKWTRDPAVVSAALDRIAADPGNGDVLRAEAEQARAERLLDRLSDAIRVAGMQFRSAVRAEESAAYNTPAFRSPRSPQTPHIQRLSDIYPSNTPAPSSDPSSPAYRGGTQVTTAVTETNAAVAQLLHEFEPLVGDHLRRIERDMQRLSGAVRFLALRDAPKGLVYFADTLRRDPGDVVVRQLDSMKHVTQFINDPLWRAEMATWNADGALQALVRDASTYGVRFYAVEGRGLGMPSNWVRSAQDTLASMALDTGGLYFLNGIAPERIADRVAADQSCWYLVSFAPAGWDTDRPLSLGVWPKATGLRVQARSALVIPSRNTMTQTRLIAAHFDDPALQTRPLTLSVYPIGGTTDGIQVLAQVRLPERDAPSSRDALWDIGFDVVSQGEVVAHTSSGVTWRGNGQPPVYQASLSVPAGPYEIVAVAHESATDSIRAGRIDGSWPPLPGEPVTLSRPALAQPQTGGIVTDGKVKATGIIVRGEGNPVDPRVSSAFVTAACVDGPKDAVYRAERRIVGETAVSFKPMALAPDEGRCVQIRDMVPAHALGAGQMTYVVSVFADEREIAAQELSFDVADVSPPAEEVISPPVK